MFSIPVRVLPVLDTLNSTAEIGVVDPDSVTFVDPHSESGYRNRIQGQ
jgi:hypothetical protein